MKCPILGFGQNRDLRQTTTPRRRHRRHPYIHKWGLLQFNYDHDTYIMEYSSVRYCNQRQGQIGLRNPGFFGSFSAHYYFSTVLLPLCVKTVSESVLRV